MVIVVAKSVPNHVITEKVLQERSSCVRSMGGHPLLLKPALAFILSQHSNEKSQKILTVLNNEHAFPCGGKKHKCPLQYHCATGMQQNSFKTMNLC
jgi:hypothetical protein